MLTQVDGTFFLFYSWFVRCCCITAFIGQFTNTQSAFSFTLFKQSFNVYIVIHITPLLCSMSHIDSSVALFAHFFWVSLKVRKKNNKKFLYSICKTRFVIGRRFANSKNVCLVYGQLGAIIRRISIYNCSDNDHISWMFTNPKLIAVDTVSLVFNSPSFFSLFSSFLYFHPFSTLNVIAWKKEQINKKKITGRKSLRGTFHYQLLSQIEIILSVDVDTDAWMRVLEKKSERERK